MTGLTTETTLIIITPLLLQLLGLTVATLNDHYINSREKTLLLLVAGISLSLIAQNYLDVWLAGHESAWFARTLTAVYGYSVRPAIIVLFIHMIDTKKNLRLLWIIVVLNAIVYSTAFYSGICIHYSETNHFQRGPLGYMAHIVGFVLLIWLLVQTLIKYQSGRRIEMIMPIGTAGFIILAAIADTFLYTGEDSIVSFLTITIVSGSVFFYIWLHLQFVREHEQALRAEQRIQIMISQIQPHFLFNTLTTIQALCKTDPNRASEVTGKFSVYLRQNIDSLSQKSLIPFSQELKHTQVYAEIERIRFPSINITYDIQDEDFYIPALTIQPLVENAIRHGVRIREMGVILVITRKSEYYHTITIWDNGKGFDVNSIMNLDDTHIGIRNVKERIETMCHGSMSITSKEDQGTKINIYIPLGGKQA